MLGGTDEMSKFQYKMYQFMQGRRGTDQFCRFLFLTSAVLLLFSMFFFNNITYYAGIALCLYGNFRALSRNLYKRERENNWYLAQKYRVTKGRTFQQRWYERRYYAYFKCPGCGQKMRAPKGKGTIKVRCHNCSTEFQRKV